MNIGERLIEDDEESIIAQKAQLSETINIEVKFAVCRSKQWNAIESAPRDNTELMLFVPRVGICTGRFDQSHWGVGPSLGGSFIWPDETDPIDDNHQPTHWQFLPEPPLT